MRKLVTLLMTAAIGCAMLVGCSNTPGTDETADETSAAISTEANTEENTTAPTQTAENTESTEDASEVKPVILVVSFGTSYNDSRDITIGAVENAIAEKFGDYEVRRAFTSQIIIDKLKDRDGLEIDNVTEAFDRLVADGVKDLVVQPTHLMHGYEYDDLVNEMMTYVNQFDSVRLGEPLLNSDEDMKNVISAITKATEEYSDDDTAIVFMGHGTEHESNAVYANLQELITTDGYNNYFIGTVEATPSLDDVLAAVQDGGYSKVVLQPLMVVAGDHANNDMAGDEEDSWKTAFEDAGFEVECLIHGLGEFEDVQAIYVQHVQDAIDSDSVAVPEDETSENTDSESKEEIVSEPISGSQIKDGTYEIEVSSSSDMFRIIKAELTVENGEMSAVLTLSGTGYEKLYMGTGEEAAADSDEACIYFVEDAEGAYTYTVPVEALNQDTDVAAWSIKKEQWYDRVLVFQSALIPEDAFVE